MQSKFPLLKRSIWGFLSLVALVFGYLGILQLTGNFHEVVPGELYRSAQLSGKQIIKKSDQHSIRTIINLRGDNKGETWYDHEIESAQLLGLHHVDFRMSSGRQLNQAEVAQLIRIMREAPKPILIHCKGGADRTGLASALYLAAIKKQGKFEAKKQLSFMYGHTPFLFLKTIAMDNTFESTTSILGYN